MSFSLKKDLTASIIFLVLTIILYFIPNGFEDRLPKNSLRCTGEILSVDNDNILQWGIVKTGEQTVKIKVLNGKYKDRIFSAQNILLGKMELDKIFKPGDKALVVITFKNGKIIFVTAQDHFRLGTELKLVLLFAFLLIIFGRLTGLRALLSFFFTAMIIWKIMVPCFLKGYDPLIISISTTAVITLSIIALVAGISQKGLTAFIGSMAGIIATCLFALYFSGEMHLHGAVKPFSETLLYSGYAHLNLAKIFISCIFIGSSGAIMDISTDIAATMEELKTTNPDITFSELLNAGLRVGRTILGTMTTTLLLAYSGSYITLLMVFMAQGVPLANLFNLNYVAAEVLHTMVGSLGLVLVAPLTALAGAGIYSESYVDLPGFRTKKIPVGEL